MLVKVVTVLVVVPEVHSYSSSHTDTGTSTTITNLTFECEERFRLVTGYWVGEW